MDSCWACLYWQLASLTRRHGRITDRVAANTLVLAEVGPQAQAGAYPRDLVAASQPDRVADYQQDQAVVSLPDRVAASPQDLAVGCRRDHVIRSSDSPASTVASGAGA